MDTNAQRKPDWIDTVDPLKFREAMIAAIADMEKAQAVVERYSPGSILLFEMEEDVLIATLGHVSRCRKVMSPPESHAGSTSYALIRAMIEKSCGRCEHLGVAFEHFNVPFAALKHFLVVTQREAVRVFTCRLKTRGHVNVILELKLEGGRVVARAQSGSRSN